MGIKCILDKHSTINVFHLFYDFIFILLFLKFYLRERKWGRGRERGEERESEAGSAASSETDVGVGPKLTNHEIMT